MTNYKIIFFLVLAAFLAEACKKEPASQEDYSPAAAVELTPFSELNAGTQKLDSHSPDFSESVLVKEYGKYADLRSDVLSVTDAHYPRIARMSNGSYIISFHDDTNANAAGVRYVTSPDFKKWNKSKVLFDPIPDSGTTRIYTNGFVYTLQNGDLMAISSFRLSSKYSSVDSRSKQGIEMKISKDCGTTWSEGVEIYHGTNWEGQILQIPSGQIQIYFSESRPWISGGHSGTGLIWSDDSGRTWQPGRMGNPYTIAREKYVHYSNGLTLFTYQMPGVARLNSGDYAGIFETRKNNAEAYGISMAWSEGFWKEIPDAGEPNPVVSDATCGPENRKNYIWDGTAPTMFQFPSGETVVGYSANVGGYHLMYKMGDATAHNFGKAQKALPHKGTWGQVSLIGTHEMAAVNRDSEESGNVGLSVQIYALNHRIDASEHSVKLDGRNGDWLASDEALFVGSSHPTPTTLRCSQDSKNLYFLIETIDKNLSSDEQLELYLTPDGSTSIGGRTVRVVADCKSVGKSCIFDGQWTAKELGIDGRSAYNGTIDDDTDLDEGFLTEIMVPKTAVKIMDGRLLVNYAIVKKGERESLGEMEQTTGWIPVGNIK